MIQSCQLLRRYFFTFTIPYFSFRRRHCLHFERKGIPGKPVIPLSVNLSFLFAQVTVKCLLTDLENLIKACAFHAFHISVPVSVNI